MLFVWGVTVYEVVSLARSSLSMFFDGIFQTDANKAARANKRHSLTSGRVAQSVGFSDEHL